MFILFFITFIMRNNGTINNSYLLLDTILYAKTIYIKHFYYYIRILWIRYVTLFYR